MPKFVIERRYLVPMYQHIVIEAENLENGLRDGRVDDIDWDAQEMDSDNARKTTITNAKLIPEDKFNASIGARVLFDRADATSPLPTSALSPAAYVEKPRRMPYRSRK